jgi:hypothetical protein
MQSAVAEQSQVLVGARKAKALCALAVTAVLVATLWPFNPRPRNGVTWLAGGGLSFEKAGMVVSSWPLSLPNDTNSLTLEFLLRPAGIKLSQTLLGFYSNFCSKQFQVQQWRQALLVTHDPRNTDQVGAVNLFLGDVFRPGQLVFVAVTAGPNGTMVYVDDRPARSFPKFEISSTDLSGEFVIGSSPVDYHPWSGELKGLAVYPKELTAQDVLRHYHVWVDGNAHLSSQDAAIARYTFTKGAGDDAQNEVASGPNLKIPPSFSIPHKPLLRSPEEEFRSTPSYVYDVAINIAGFVPLGLIVCSYLVWTRSLRVAILTTITYCGSLSFVIEVIQYYIPKRASGMTDVITNTLGAALGALLTQWNLVRDPLERIGIIPISEDAAGTCTG